MADNDRTPRADAPENKKGLKARDRASRKERGTVKFARLDRKLDAILRALYVDADRLPYPERLLAQRFPMYAQNEEDGLTLAVLRETGMETHRFVEIGCGENGGNSGFLARELGFSGLMIDGSRDRIEQARRRFPAHRVAVVEAFVSRENINGLIGEHGLEGEIDFLSIDIDGNDLWIWSAIHICNPRVVVVEYNSLFGSDRAVTVPYDPAFARRELEPRRAVRGQLFGASLRAACLLAQRRGYRLVVVEPRGTNAYFMRSDLAPSVPALEPQEAFRVLDKHRQLTEGGFDLWRVVAEHDIPLVDLDAHPDALG